ncbi:MAG: hypothetical protein HKN43_01815 [Rhodothermales bacterium]|nr:hypothetical protein [Rhodothermales bacterium]
MKFLNRSILSRREAARILSLSIPVALAPFRVKPKKSNGEVLSYALFFDEDEVPRIRTLFSNDVQFEDVRSDILGIDIAAETASLDSVEYNDQLGHIIRLSLLIEKTAFRYLMTDDLEAAELSAAAIRSLMKFDRWDIYMDGSDSIGVQRAPEATLAVVTAIDWLGNYLTPDERKSWIRTLGEKGCEACYRALHDMVYPQDAEGWRFDPESTFFDARPEDQHDLNRRAEIISNTNLRALPASAIVVGAVAYQNEVGTDADSERWLEMGEYSIDVFRDFFGEDGSWNEEVHYANYTALHLLKGAIALVRTGRSNLLDVVDWRRYASFLQHMSLPTTDDKYGVVNFGDSGNRKGYPHTFTRAAVPVWIASQFEDPEIQWFANSMAGTHTHWSAIWMDPLVEAKAPVNVPTLWVSSFDRVVARDGWSEESLVVAMRSGPPANHEHADRNSIIVKAFGQILVSDPLRPPYGYADPAWPMRLTVGHSAVLIDGKGHEHHNGVEGTNASSSYARVTTSRLTKSYAHWKSVATQAYRLVDLDVKDVERSVAVLFDAHVVLVVDYVSRYKGSATVTARFFGDNSDGQYSQIVEDNGFTRIRPGVVMKASAYSNASFSVVSGVPFVPEPTASLHPFVDVVTEASGDVLLVTVQSIATEEAQPATVQLLQTETGFDTEIGDQQIRIGREGITIG